MDISRTYPYDFNCDQNKNADSKVCSAISNTKSRLIQVRAMFQKIPRDLKYSDLEAKDRSLTAHLSPRAKWLRG